MSGVFVLSSGFVWARQEPNGAWTMVRRKIGATFWPTRRAAETARDAAPMPIRQFLVVEL